MVGRAQALAWHIGGIGALSMAGGVGFLVVRCPVGKKGSSPPMLRPAPMPPTMAALPPESPHMTTTLKIDFVSDVSCPWCIIGLKALEQAAERLQLSLIHI